MKKIDTYYYTTSYGGTEGRDIEERKFLTEKAARENAKSEDWNNSFTLYKVDRYTNELDEIIEKSTYLAQIASKSTPETYYYKLYGVDDKNNVYPLCAFDNPRESRLAVPNIDKENNYEFYYLFRINENLINNEIIETHDYIAKLPSLKNEEVSYYSLRALDKYGYESELLGFKTLEEVKEHIIVPQKDYLQYNYYDTTSVLVKGIISENRTLVRQVQNDNKIKKKKKL